MGGVRDQAKPNTVVVKEEPDTTKEILSEAFNPGKADFGIDIKNVDAGPKWTQLYDTPMLVRKAIIQNISTENVTVVRWKDGATAGQGMLLNAAAAGEGGGSIPLGNIDLSKLWIYRATAGSSVSVYWER